MLHVLPPTFKPFSQQIKVAASWVNTDFWLDKIMREPRHALDLDHLLQKNFVVGPVSGTSH